MGCDSALILAVLDTIPEASAFRKGTVSSRKLHALESQWKPCVGTVSPPLRFEPSHKMSTLGVYVRCYGSIPRTHPCEAEIQRVGKRINGVCPLQSPVYFGISEARCACLRENDTTTKHLLRRASVLVSFAISRHEMIEKAACKHPWSPQLNADCSNDLLT